MASSYVVRLLSSPLCKGTRCYSLSMKATKEYPNANTMPANAFIGLSSIETSNMPLSITTCQCHCLQEPRQPLKPTLAPEHPWQHLGADFMHFDGNEYLIIIDYYSKMPFVHKIPSSQYNGTKMISTLKELFTEHGIPESHCSDNGPQFASALFAEFAADWNFNHCTSAPTNPCSNSQAEAVMKIITEWCHSIFAILTHALLLTMTI